MIICLDTMIVIWGVKRDCTEGQERMIEMAEQVIHRAQDRNHRLVLPAQVVTEYLAGFPVEFQFDAIEQIKRDFFVVPFDLPAAAIAGRPASQKDLLKDIRDDTGRCRQCMKGDISVIASSIAGHAQMIISEETEVFRGFAQGEILVKSMAEYLQDSFNNDDGDGPSRQSSLFD